MRSAASVTPPLAPNSLPADVRSPNGVSGASGASVARSRPCARISSASSRVVRTASMSGRPSRAISGRPASNFLAVHGMMATLKMRAGSIFSRSAKKLLMTAPSICCGLLQVERFGIMSG